MIFEEVIVLPVREKISRFKNIGDINNLCITKRSINKKKGVLSEDEFKF